MGHDRRGLRTHARLPHALVPRARRRPPPPVGQRRRHPQGPRPARPLRLHRPLSRCRGCCCGRSRPPGCGPWGCRAVAYLGGYLRARRCARRRGSRTRSSAASSGASCASGLGARSARARERRPRRAARSRRSRQREAEARDVRDRRHRAIRAGQPVSSASSSSACAQAQEHRGPDSRGVHLGRRRRARDPAPARDRPRHRRPADLQRGPLGRRSC